MQLKAATVVMALLCSVHASPFERIPARYTQDDTAVLSNTVNVMQNHTIALSNFFAIFDANPNDVNANKDNANRALDAVVNAALGSMILDSFFGGLTNITTTSQNLHAARIQASTRLRDFIENSPDKSTYLNQHDVGAIKNILCASDTGYFSSIDIYFDQTNQRINNGVTTLSTKPENCQ